MGILKEYIKIAIRSLRRSKIRSWLTMIGVVIGVFLIISLLSLSEGIKGAILQQLSMIGKDIIMVFPGELDNLATAFGGDLELSNNDIDAIEKAKGVQDVVPMNYKALAVRFKGEVKTILINGISLDKGLTVLRDDMGWQTTDGRWSIPGKKEIVIGKAIPENIFPGIKAGDEVTINGKKFEVAGVLQSLGNQQDDSSATMDLAVFQSLTGERDGAKFAMAKVKPGYDVDSVAENIEKELNESRKRVRGIDSPTFSVLTSEKATAIVEDILAIIQAAIFGFASISIIVGAVGIMNTMYTSVHERIREIGIMKAVGAKRKTITTIFLIESGFFGLFGGIGGIILGLGLAKIAELVLKTTGGLYLEASMSPWLILFGLTFSFLIGCLAGYFPAR
ncbi:ABC transporter permease, partial [Patescibacteria group bacterium]|nr:ABC transporter permease [Patescibacteria group bacterium]